MKKCPPDIFLIKSILNSDFILKHAIIGVTNRLNHIGKGGNIVNALRRHEQERVEEVLQNLRAKGIRITDTRRAVLSYLVASHEHPSAEKIYRDLLPQFPSMSLATVYNNIKVLIDEGVVSEIKVRNDTTTYFDFMGHDH